MCYCRACIVCIISRRSWVLIGRTSSAEAAAAAAETFIGETVAGDRAPIISCVRRSSKSSVVYVVFDRKNSFCPLRCLIVADASSVAMRTTATIGGGGGGSSSCLGRWQEPYHMLFQLAHIAMLLSFLAPNNKYGLLFLHAMLIAGRYSTTIISI